jgi:hypothetical protein
MLAVVDLKGSGAATLESFCVVLAWFARRERLHFNTFSHFVQTMAAGGQGKGCTVRQVNICGLRLHRVSSLSQLDTARDP